MRGDTRRGAVNVGVVLGAMMLATMIFTTGSRTAIAQASCGGIYIVAPGDTLSALARRCGTSVAAILAANPAIADPDRIPVGLRVQLPASPGADGGDGPTYTVQPGDTLFSIAERIDTTVPALVGANPSLEAPARILVGQRLNIPSGGTGPPVFTAVDVPLIAQGGGDVGCGDRVVFVERPVEPTRAPLLATLETLLAVDELSIGQSGLSNPLAESNLRLDDLDLWDGRATIRLAGDLRLGGVCDGPRVAAQLRLSALQYSTVDDIAIFVNGEPLDQILSGR